MQAQNDHKNVENGSLSSRLKQRRAETGMNQDELADKAGISKTILSRYERGVAEPKPSTLLKLAQALQCSPDWLEHGVVSTTSERYQLVELPVPNDMMSRIMESARASGREPATEILYRLEESYSVSPSEVQKMQEMAFHAFQATSEDFEKELSARVGKYLIQVLSEAHPELELPEGAIWPIELEEFFGKMPAAVARGLFDKISEFVEPAVPDTPTDAST